MKIGQLEINLRELAEFIVEAKKSCYAGNGKEEKADDGSKILTFQKGDFYYTDNYFGFYNAPGNEIVKWKKTDGQRIWQMSYSGGMLPQYWGNEKLAKEVFVFLKEALSNITLNYPFRGPTSLNNKKGLCYSNRVLEGDIKKFKGTEWIYNNQEEILFSQDYIGGLAIPK